MKDIKKELDKVTKTKNNESEDLKEKTDRMYRDLIQGDSVNQTDMAQAVEVMNKDKVDKEGFTSIDMNTDLTLDQISIITRLETLALRGVYPRESINMLIRKFKRNMVSVNRKGRKESLAVIGGVRDHEETPGGFWKKLISSGKENR